MKQDDNDIVAESTPILNLKDRPAPQASGKVVNPVVNPVHWESDSTEVYTDYEDEDAAACLITENGDKYAVTRFPFVIGRDDDCDLILHGKGVSRRHAEIVLQSGHFVVNDLNSLNGIKVNGYKVARVILEEGDSLKFGEVNLTFQPGLTEGANFVADEYSGADIAGAYRQGPMTEEKTQVTSPMRTVMATMLTLVLLIFFGAAAYLYLTKNTDLWTLKPMADAGVESDEPLESMTIEPTTSTAVKTPVADTPPPGLSAVAPTQPATQPATNSPPPSLVNTDTSAPSGLSSSANSTSNTSKPASDDPAPALASLKAAPEKPATPSLPKVEPKPVVKPEPVVSAPKPVAPVLASLNAEAARAITKADDQYLSGYGSDALNTMSPYLGSDAVTGKAATDLSKKYDTVLGLTRKYSQTQELFNDGSYRAGIDSAKQFIQQEQAAFGNRSSEYRDSLLPMMSSAYLSMGNLAAQQDQPRKAYKYWQEAVEASDNRQAAEALEAAESRAQSLYRQALRLEYVNPEKAIVMWQEIRDSLPPESEYYAKSNAKIAWYEKWGT